MFYNNVFVFLAEGSGWSLKHLDSKENEEDETDSKNEAEKATRSDSNVIKTQELVDELLDNYDRRKLRRRGATRQSFRDVVRERGSLRQRRQRLSIESAGSLLGQEDENAENLASLINRHMALTHEDTSTGAVHCFQDEYGENLCYFLYH